LREFVHRIGSIYKRLHKDARQTKHKLLAPKISHSAEMLGTGMYASD